MHLSAKYSCALFIQSTIDKLELGTINNWCFRLPLNVSFNLVTTCSVCYEWLRWVLKNICSIQPMFVSSYWAKCLETARWWALVFRFQDITRWESVLISFCCFQSHHSCIIGKWYCNSWKSQEHHYSIHILLEEFYGWYGHLYFSIIEGCQNEDGDISERQKLCTNLELQRPKNILCWCYWDFTKLFFI